MEGNSFTFKLYAASTSCRFRRFGTQEIHNVHYAYRRSYTSLTSRLWVGFWPLFWSIVMSVRSEPPYSIWECSYFLERCMSPTTMTYWPFEHMWTDYLDVSTTFCKPPRVYIGESCLCGLVCRRLALWFLLKELSVLINSYWCKYMLRLIIATLKESM